QDGLRSHVCPGSRRPSLARGRSEAWTQHGAGRHHAGREITPQRHHQLARQRHDGDAAHPSLHVANALTEPAAEIAARLMPQPQPGELDRKLARTPVAGLADALLAAALAAVVRRARKPEIAADLTAIVERAIECLVDQPLPADRTDALELDELPYLGLGRAGLSGSRAALLATSSAFNCLATKHSRSCSRTISSLSHGASIRPSPVRISSMLARKPGLSGWASRTPWPCNN